MKLLIRGGRVIDPANNLDEVLDILIEDSRIAKIAKNIKAEADKVIDAVGKIVMPGAVDMHTHLREPGREDEETVLSATRAALAGGVTSLLAMPNTSPAMDCPDNVWRLKGIISNTSAANVFICGAITRGRQGKELTDIASLKREEVLAISDDGCSVDNEEIFLQALKEAQENNLLVISHCEDKKLSNGGVVNLGWTSTRLGLRGISRESEYNRVERDIQLAQRALARIHIAHVSCKESVEIIAQAKKKAIKVTAETAPHYFSLTEEAVLNYDSNKKMNPPLRAQEDVLALKQALKDGTIDAIASDHAPHTENEKEIEFERAEFGVIGLETELALSISELISSGLLDWSGLVRKISLNPARILGLGKGTLGIGADADLVVLDPDKEWTVEKSAIISKSKNSAFLGRQLKGRVEYTIVNGNIVYPFRE